MNIARINFLIAYEISNIWDRPAPIIPIGVIDANWTTNLCGIVHTAERINVQSATQRLPVQITQDTDSLRQILTSIG